MCRRSGSAWRLHLIAQDLQFIHGDFVKQPLLGCRQNVAIDGMLAHRTRTISAIPASASHLTAMSPKFFAAGSALLALLFQCRGTALGDSLLSIEQLFTGRATRP
jgi:hypothetical protein